MRHSRRLLSRYFDGELSAREAGALERHLHRCPRCRGELRDLQALSDLLELYGGGRRAGPEVPEHLRRRLEERVFGRARRPAESRPAWPDRAHGRGRRLWAAAGIAALLAACLFAGWLAGERLRESGPAAWAAFAEEAGIPPETAIVAEMPEQSLGGAYLLLLASRADQ